MRVLYTLVWYLLIPLVLLYFFWRGRRAPAYRQRWRERFGCHGGAVPGSVWIHAASVGEVVAAAPLIEALLQRYPNTPLVVTTTTPTGSERVQALFGGRVRHGYWPWDVPGALRRFWRAYAPTLVILLEMELWPNLVAEARRRGVPVVLANGRLSAGSHRGYARCRALVRPMLAAFEALAVQTPEDAARLIDLGAEPARVAVTGNIKFDMTLDDSLRARAAALRQSLGARPIWIAASTHPGEDEIVLAAHEQLRARHPTALLVLVPRHPERFAAVATLARERGHVVVVRSSGDLPGVDTSVYLADTMGELLMLYGVADIAFVGGSLVPVGGHNLLEPALWQLPILSGPVLHNFTQVAALLDDAGALQRVAGEQALADALTELVGAEAIRRERGQAAAQVVAAHRGALGRLMAVLVPHWPAP